MDIKDKWWISETGNIVNKDGIICSMPDNSEKSKRNAKIIASALDLLEALEHGLQTIDANAKDRSIFLKSENAIRKATQ